MTVTNQKYIIIIISCYPVLGGYVSVIRAQTVNIISVFYFLPFWLMILFNKSRGAYQKGKLH
jgi:hypothetical protein